MKVKGGKVGKRKKLEEESGKGKKKNRFLLKSKTTTGRSGQFQLSLHPTVVNRIFTTVKGY